jgi:acetoin utilization deacetylase AcuC-like enzyme
MSFPVAYAPIYVHPVPENHRFPMEKYSLLKEQLVYEGIISPTDLFEPTVIEQRHLFNAS